MTDSIDPRSYGSDVNIAGQAVTLQIVVIAMVLGVSIFGGYLIATGHLQKPPQGTTLSLAAVGFGALMAILHVVIPGVVERAALANQSIDAGAASIVQVYAIRTIIAAALLEGAAFLSLAAVMIEHHAWVLGVTAVLLGLMLMQIPSRTRIQHWLEARLMERDQAGAVRPR